MPDNTETKMHIAIEPQIQKLTANLETYKLPASHWEGVMLWASKKKQVAEAKISDYKFLVLIIGNCDQLNNKAVEELLETVQRQLHKRIMRHLPKPSEPQPVVAASTSAVADRSPNYGRNGSYKNRSPKVSRQKPTTTGTRR